MEKWFPCDVFELGPTPGPTCVILKVSPHQTVHVTRWRSGKTHRESYEIQPDLTLHSRADDEAPSDKTREKYEQFQNHASEPLSVEEADLEFLFAQEWPEWLTPILTAQLRDWRQHHLEHYFHYTPWEMSRDDVWRCVKATPAQALRRFGHVLTRSQRDICCRNAPPAAAAYALETLDSFARRRALENYPEEVLRHASLQLADSELIALAARCPQSVFKSYRCMPPRQMALALSTALTRRRGNFHERLFPMEEFLQESLAKFPGEWLAGSGGTFDAILTSWAERIGKIPDGKQMIEIHEKLPPDYRAAFKNAIARHI